jgi:hypothetical protein
MILPIATGSAGHRHSELFEPLWPVDLTHYPLKIFLSVLPKTYKKTRFRYLYKLRTTKHQRSEMKKPHHHPRRFSMKTELNMSSSTMIEDNAFVLRRWGNTCCLYVKNDEGDETKLVSLDKHPDGVFKAYSEIFYANDYRTLKAAAKYLWESRSYVLEQHKAKKALRHAAAEAGESVEDYLLALDACENNL